MKPDPKPLPAAMPLCWDLPANWAEWQRLNAFVRDNSASPLDHYCTDCLPEYKARMVAEGRCGHPETQFIRIVEYGRDPVTRARVQIQTDALKGVHHAA